jgi:hypothetical protein
MRDVLDCARAEELFSDYRENALPAPLRADLENHLSTCTACPGLLRALEDVLGVLHAPLDLDPSASLPARVAEASWRRARTHVVASAQEHAVRLVEDLRMLRVMIATAFEGRVDRVNDRVDDYRRLLEKRRQHLPDSRQSRTGAHSRVVDHLRTGGGTVS